MALKNYIIPHQDLEKLLLKDEETIEKYRKKAFPEPRKCEYCGEMFVSHKANARCCNHSCMAKLYEIENRDHRNTYKNNWHKQNRLIKKMEEK